MYRSIINILFIGIYSITTDIYSMISIHKHKPHHINRLESEKKKINRIHNEANKYLSLLFRPNTRTFFGSTTKNNLNALRIAFEQTTEPVQKKIEWRCRKVPELIILIKAPEDVQKHILYFMFNKNEKFARLFYDSNLMKTLDKYQKCVTKTQFNPILITSSLDCNQLTALSYELCFRLSKEQYKALFKNISKKGNVSLYDRYTISTIDPDIEKNFENLLVPTLYEKIGFAGYRIMNRIKKTIKLLMSCNKFFELWK